MKLIIVVFIIPIISGIIVFLFKRTIMLIAERSNLLDVFKDAIKTVVSYPYKYFLIPVINYVYVFYCLILLAHLINNINYNIHSLFIMLNYKYRLLGLKIIYKTVIPKNRLGRFCRSLVINIFWNRLKFTNRLIMQLPDLIQILSKHSKSNKNDSKNNSFSINSPEYFNDSKIFNNGKRK